MSDVTITDNDDPYFSINYEGHVIAGTEGVYCPVVDGFYDPPKDLNRGDDCPACGNQLDC